MEILDFNNSNEIENITSKAKEINLNEIKNKKKYNKSNHRPDN